MSTRLMVTDWNIEPGVLVPLVLSALLYLRGARILSRRGAGKAICRRDVVAFCAGWLCVVAALASPLDEVADQLFSAHMVQHELLMALAAPLLVSGRPAVAMVWALPAAGRQMIARALRSSTWRSTWRFASRPFDAWLLHGVVIWGWHVPVVFDAAVSNDAVHALQHVSFLGSALLFWWTVLHPARKAERGLAILFLFTTAIHTAVLGALMSFARVPWYSVYETRTAAWGMSPLADQQLAGLVMWIPAGGVYLIAALLVLRQWLRESEWSVRRAELAAPAPHR